MENKNQKLTHMILKLAFIALIGLAGVLAVKMFFVDNPMRFQQMVVQGMSQRLQSELFAKPIQIADMITNIYHVVMYFAF